MRGERETLWKRVLLPLKLPSFPKTFIMAP